MGVYWNHANGEEKIFIEAAREHWCPTGNIAEKIFWRLNFDQSAISNPFKDFFHFDRFFKSRDSETPVINNYDIGFKSQQISRNECVDFTWYLTAKNSLELCTSPSWAVSDTKKIVAHLTFSLD